MYFDWKTRGIAGGGVDRYFGFGMSRDQVALVRDLSPRRQSKAVEKVGGDAGDVLRREAKKRVSGRILLAEGENEGSLTTSPT